MPYCGDHFLMHMNIESLYCTPEIQYYISIIIQEKKNQASHKKREGEECTTNSRTKEGSQNVNFLLQT